MTGPTVRALVSHSPSLPPGGTLKWSGQLDEIPELTGGGAGESRGSQLGMFNILSRPTYALIGAVPGTEGFPVPAWVVLADLSTQPSAKVISTLSCG